MAEDEEYKVSSEIYSEFEYATKERPAVNPNNVISKFKFKYQHRERNVDKDGDFVVPRKGETEKSDEFLEILIEHSQSTALDLVGLQVWRGALLLADWLLYNEENIPENTIILELGSGVGLSSIVASLLAPVMCTDIKKGGILKLIKKNIARNERISKYPVKVLELDFKKQILHPKIVEVLENIGIIIAADVVYDDTITAAFVWTIGHLLSKPPKRTVYIALEKRYVFTVENLDVGAPCYDYFLECLKKLKKISFKEIQLDFPQYFEYERIKELTLLEVSSNFE